MNMNFPAFWRDRLWASSVHFGLSLVLGALSAFLVFGVWYPYPYSEISGGRDLFLLVVGVDVALGPLITLFIFNRKKSSRMLKFDLLVVVAIQLAALSYGLWAVTIARPVHMVFEYNRFSVIHAVDVPVDEIAKTPDGVVALPFTGPTLLSLRDFKDNKEYVDVTTAALAGLPLGARPFLWQPYASAIPQVLKEAKPVDALKVRFANQAAKIDQVLIASGHHPNEVVYLPLVGRGLFWTVFLDASTAQVVAVMPLDPF